MRYLTYPSVLGVHDFLCEVAKTPLEVLAVQNGFRAAPYATEQNPRKIPSTLLAVVRTDPPGSDATDRHHRCGDQAELAFSHPFQRDRQDMNMHKIQRTLQNFLLMAAATVSLMSIGSPALAATAEDLNHDATQALQLLYKTNPEAAAIAERAKGILVFPNVVKAGLVFGGSYGEGVLTKGGKFAGYYNSVSASWGWQAGAQSYSYVVFLMSDDALAYLDKSEGWEIGVGPTVVVVDEGAAKNLSSSTLKDDAYAFIFDQTGLMASLSIEGTKITPIKR